MQVADLFAKLSLKTDKSSFSAGDRLISGIKTAVAAFAAFEIAKHVTEMVYGAIELGDHLDELAQRTGVSVEALQEFGYAAKQSGVDMEEMTSSITKLNKNIYEARHGNANLRESFQKLGIPVKDLRKLKADEAMARIADKFATMPDGPKKAALAIAVFGKSGSRLIPVLNQGRASLEKLKQEFKDSGAEIDGNSAKAMGEFNDQVDNLKASAKGLIVQFAIELLPTLKELAGSVREWVKNNRELLQQKVKQFAETVAFGLRKLGEFFAYLIMHQKDVETFIKIFVAGWVLIQGAAVAAAIAANAAWLPLIAAIMAAYSIYKTLQDAKLSDFQAGGGADDVGEQRKAELDAKRQTRYAAYRHPGQDAKISVAGPTQFSASGPNIETKIEVNVPPGTDEATVAKMVADKWDEKMRQTHGLVPRLGGAQ